MFSLEEVMAGYRQSSTAPKRNGPTMGEQRVSFAPQLRTFRSRLSVAPKRTSPFSVPRVENAMNDCRLAHPAPPPSATNKVVPFCR